MLKKLKTKTQLMSAAMMTGAMFGFSNIAEANDLNTYLENTSGRVNQIPDLVAFLSYIGGAALAALGVVKLKAHVENPSQNPMKDGLARLGFGGMLLAMPSITSTMLTTAAGGGEAAYSGFTGDLAID